MSGRTEKALVSVVLATTLHPAFQWVAAATSARSRVPPWWLVTPLDQVMQLVPAMVWVYVSWYPAAALVLLAPTATFRRAYVSYVLAFVVCLLGFVCFPVTIARPDLGDRAGTAAMTLRAIYAADLPVNLFPSFHAAVALVLASVARKTWIAGAATAWCIALCAACVMTRQHYVLDVVAGAAVGWLSVRSADNLLGAHWPLRERRLSPLVRPGWAATPRRQPPGADVGCGQ